MAFSFERLEVWKKAIELSKDVHFLTKSFPKDELFVLSSQMKRATDSISLNIAEGSFGQTKKEFTRFLVIAQRSALEVVTCCYLARDRGYIDQNQFSAFYTRLESLTKMIQALKNSLKENNEHGRK